MARRVMRFEVTETHVQNGVRGDACRCPAALALEEARGMSVIVGSLMVDFLTPGSMETEIWSTSDRLMDEIHSFDSGGRFTPGFYTITRQEDQ
jgi:hypothetical protein